MSDKKKKPGRPQEYLRIHHFEEWRKGDYWHFKVITQAQLAAILIVLGLVLALLLH